jgi:hypothetical protein
VSTGILGKFSDHRDPRWAREMAAQILELRLGLRQNAPAHASLARGVEFIHEAIEGARGDRILLPRILETGLNLHLAALAHPDLWSSYGKTDMAVARTWHHDLREILDKQRNDAKVLPKEISQRARSLEIIGFVFQEPTETQTDGSGRDAWAALDRARIPPDLLFFARELREEIKLSVDNCAKLIIQALDRIIQRRLRRRDLIYAPIWASHHTEWIIELIDDPEAVRLARSAYHDLSRLTGGSRDTAVSADERNVLEKIAVRFERLAQILQPAVASEENERARQAIFYARMEACYAKLLLALLDETGRTERLSALIQVYRSIADDYPKASIPHFRLDTIFSELGNNEEAFSELAQAVTLVDDDPYLRNPAHWVRSTMQRRVAARFSEEAARLRRRLIEQPTAELCESYFQSVLAAYQSMRSGGPERLIEEADFLYSLEARRRTNNLLYYASLVLEVCPGEKGFRWLELDETDMRRWLAQLVPGGDINNVLELGVIHTVGAAHAALGDVDQAVAAGNRLIEVAKESEDATDHHALLNDAFMWIQRKNLLSAAAINAWAPRRYFEEALIPN